MTRINIKSSAPRSALRKPTYYAVLGVPPGAALDTIHAAYLDLAFVLHPDRGGDEEKFKVVALAWGHLKNADARKRYDAQLKLERRACKECQGRGLLRKSASFTTVREVPCRACEGEGYL
jgi:curved DNA-binding protein CbpA